MSKAIVINFNISTDIQSLLYAYQDKLSHCDYMIEKLKSNSYKSDNSEEIMGYTLEKQALEFFIRKLESLDLY